MAINSEIIVDGDVGWAGFRSRPDPLTLDRGIASMARNMRFVRGRAEVRKGAKRLLDGVSVGTAPVVLPFTFPVDVAVTKIERTSTTATVVCSADHGFLEGDQVNIRGSAVSAYNGDKVVMAGRLTDKNFTFTVAGSPADDTTSTMWVTNGVEIRDAYTGGIFGACVFSSPDSSDTGNGSEYIALFGSDNCYLYRQGESVVTKNYPNGEIIEEQDFLCYLQAFNKLFLFRARPLTETYARKSCSIACSAGTATVTCVAHGFSTNERICIEGANQAAYNIEADIAKTGDDTFTFSVLHIPVSPATGTITCRIVKPPLVWDGGSGNFIKFGGGSHAAGATYSTMRSTGVACYQNNQLFVAATPVKDTVLISDVLDENTFDPLQESFRANAGSDDYIVALHPFAEGTTLVMGRKSIYRAKIVMDYQTGTTFDPTSSFIELVTNEMGCRAARTVVTAGQYVYFLSDSGVYRLDTSYTDLKVRGVTLPLSDAIADQFDDMSESAVGLSNAVWHDNRYWLSVPTGTSEFPNTLLIWNALTGEWESVDSFPASIATLLVSDYSNRRRLFGASRSGKLFLLEEREDGDDPADEATLDTVDIAGVLTTRRFSGGDMLGKRWLRVVSGISLPAGSGVSVQLNTYDPENEMVVGSLTNAGSAEEGYVAKMSARARGAAADVLISNTGPGRPVIRTCQVDVALARPSATTRTES